MSVMDESLTPIFFDYIQRSLMIFGTIIIISIVIPHVLLIIPILLYGLMYYRRAYKNSSNQMNRLDNTTKTPINSFLSNTLEGAAIVRSFGCENPFVKEYHRLINRNTKVYFVFSTAGRWLSIRF
jgi:ABC-type bacteriocin/lantibiotic exporter with double-glycine peptidase domain